MQNSRGLKTDLKTFAVASFATAFLTILLSIIAHFYSPNRLIPLSVIGGNAGLSLGVYICFRLNYINRKGSLPVLLCSLIYFNAMSFIAVFNLNSPLIILGGFSLTGVVTIITNYYFKNHQNISANKIYAALGLILSFPALYFVVASILKFQFGRSYLFHFIDELLKTTNGQQNFNAITPILFGGGLMLAFGLNVLSQIERIKTSKNFSFQNLRVKYKTLNLIVVLLTGFTGLAILSYLAVENL